MHDVRYGGPGPPSAFAVGYGATSRDVRSAGPAALGQTHVWVSTRACRGVALAKAEPAAP
jgi:hypothetical protein